MNPDIVAGTAPGPLTPQQFFDAALFGIRAQKYAPSALFGPNGSVTCLYRGPNGTKCGFGQAIPDDVYHVEMGSFTAAFLLGHFSEYASASRYADPVGLVKAAGALKHLFQNCPVELCDQVQKAHDQVLANKYSDCYSKRWWEVRMESTAVEFELHYTPVE